MIYDNLPNREKLLDSFKPGVKLYKSTFLKIFGYEISTPGFANEALSRLESLGCSKAKEYYTEIVSEWKDEHEKMLQEAAAWYRKQDFNKEGVRTSRRQQEVEQANQSSRKWMENLY